MIKLFNVLMLMVNSKKKSIGSKLFSLYLRTISIILILAICIIILTNQYGISFRDTLIISIVLFVMLFIVMSIIDSHIIKKYLQPLQTLVDSANKINDGKDLSKRLNVENNTNQKVELEIQMISKTFNRMFNRLQCSFEHENQFSRDISHEIKTPLAVIISSCEYASDMTTNPAEMKDTLDTIMVEANRISNITSKLSALAKLQDDSRNLDYEDFCINELVSLTADEVLIEYEYKNITINILGDTNIMVHADRIMLVRMFINLISNSVKYGVQDGCTNIYLYQNECRLIGLISDNGIGIPEESINDIWEPFFKVDRSNPNSTGLGLPMVKKIVSVHGGNIYAKSVLGEGTDFHFVMPIIKT